MSGKLAGRLATAAILHSKSPVVVFRHAQESRSKVHSALIKVACSGKAEKEKKKFIKILITCWFNDKILGYHFLVPEGCMIMMFYVPQEPKSGAPKFYQ